MKKMLLLLVSGLLLVCMAGSAMAAYSSSIWNEADNEQLVSIPLVPGAPGEIVSYRLSGVPVDGSTHRYLYDVTSDTKITATVSPLLGTGVGSDVKVEYINHPDFSFVTSSSTLTDIVSTSTGEETGTYHDVANLKITLLSGELGNTYRVKIPIYEDGTLQGYATAQVSTASSSVDVTAVPEFPTVALPVAALIGLVFIFGRKKEGL